MSVWHELGQSDSLSDTFTGKNEEQITMAGGGNGPGTRHWGAAGSQ